MPQSEYFLGIGPSKDDPLYGLLDTTANFFYLVDYRLHIIHQLAKILNTTQHCVIVDISSCNDWQHNLIDNDVCDRWGILNLSHIQSATMIVGSVLVEQKTAVSSSTDKIIQSNLQICRQVLQHLISVDESVIEKKSAANAAHLMILDDQWISNASHRELQYFLQWHDTWQEAKAVIVSSLMAVPLTQIDFVQSLKTLLEHRLSLFRDRSVSFANLYVWL